MLYSFVDVHFFSFFFSATILSGPYLWNRYSQRLQIQCAAWSCGLVVHYCLPSNSLCYFFFFFRQDFVRVISLELLLAGTPNWVWCLVLRSSFALLLTIQFASLFFLFFFFFCHDFVRAISLEPLLAETPNWVCCLVLQSNFALLLTIQFASLLDQNSGDRSSVAYRATENLSRLLSNFIHPVYRLSRTPVSDEIPFAGLSPAIAASPTICGHDF